jgi:hypothetical protein
MNDTVGETMEKIIQDDRYIGGKANAGPDVLAGAEVV